MQMKVISCLLFASLVLHMPTILSRHDKPPLYSLLFTDHVQMVMRLGYVQLIQNSSVLSSSLSSSIQFLHWL